MKWLIATTLAGSTALAPVAINEVEMRGESIQFDFVENTQEEFTIPSDPVLVAIKLREADLHEKQYWINKKESEIRERKKQRMMNVLDELKGHVGKTPYVFSGASPSGWDCSGLVMWTYAQLGIELPHSARAQLSSGKHVTDPRPGDIVVWGGGYHSGIYLGDGKVLNALNPRVDTNIMDENGTGGSVVYVRVYDY